MLAGKGSSTNILYNELKNEYDISTVILEDSVNKVEFLKKRIKNLGAWQVFGQILFQLIIVPLLNISSSERKKEILSQYHLHDSAIPKEKIINVKSVNHDDCLNHLQKIAPNVIIVNGTRIISKKILNSVQAIFINMHVGITPKYRGVHGGYWALVNNDKENFGVTIHLVDSGIDTGNILYQKTIDISKKDNFVTYPLIQLAYGIPYIKKALSSVSNLTPKPHASDIESKLWHHPTIIKYLYNWIKNGIK